MNLTLVYDTETSGLPLWNQPSEHPDQPRVLQLHAELFNDDTGETYATLSSIIKPEGWTVPAEITAITGITQEKAQDLGRPIGEVLPEFIDLWRRGGVRVAHNESFDMRMVRIELMRHPGFKDVMITPDISYADFWKRGEAYCTQVGSTKILNLPPTEKMRAARRNHPKSPNLAEAFEFFTGTKLENAHDAAVDVAACKQVYFGIRKHNEQRLAA